jgi:NAD(P)-dependent dehydrogenase (short-subunit alcohol dehydrogenase family)
VRSDRRAQRHHAYRPQCRRDAARLLEQASAEDVGDLAQLHLGSALVVLQACLPAMKRNRFGRVVMISSRAALGAVGRWLFRHQGRSRRHGPDVGLELAPFGITVSMVAPGPIRDRRRRPDSGRQRREAALASAIPMKRLGRPRTW